MKSKMTRIASALSLCLILSLSYIYCWQNPVEITKPEEENQEVITVVYKDKAEVKEEKEEPEEVEEEQVVAEEPAPVEEVAPPAPYRVLIDPGHYAGSALITFEDGTTFSEGDYTLAIAQNLQAILQANGIQADMTRTSGTITIGGRSNYDLDSTNISARGTMSSGYDLFVSIHTNSNDINANGYPTFEQPTSINKPLIILNSVSLGTPNIISMANAIGENLTQTLINNGLSSGVGFSYTNGGIPEWTPEYNNALGVGGTVCKRGNNYYGVLRGAANVGTPGMIIEHGYHSNPEFRNLLVNGDLAYQLAAADASAIVSCL